MGPGSHSGLGITDSRGGSRGEIMGWDGRDGAGGREEKGGQWRGKAVDRKRKLGRGARRRWRASTLAGAMAAVRVAGAGVGRRSAAMA